MRIIKFFSGALIFNRLEFPNMFSYCASIFQRKNQTPKRNYLSIFKISDKTPLTHYIGSGRIAITFNQPMFIEVLQFYLWFKDFRRYHYFVQISKNLVDWELISDSTNYWCFGLQTVQIMRNLISIRIVGTDVHPNTTVDTNDGRQEFRIIHLDFPQL